MVFLHYRKPPLYDETLNKTAIFILKWGAFFYVAIAYWILTNKQMFQNVLDPIEYKDFIEDYHHHIFELQFRTTVPKHTHKRVLLFYALSLLLVLICLDLFESSIGNMWSSIPLLRNKKGHQFAPFSKLLKPKDKEHLLQEEKLRREKFGYKLLQDDFYKNLQEQSSGLPTGLNKNLREEDPRSYDVSTTGLIENHVTYDPLDSLENAISYSYVPVERR